MAEWSLKPCHRGTASRRFLALLSCRLTLFPSKLGGSDELAAPGLHGFKAHYLGRETIPLLGYIGMMISVLLIIYVKCLPMVPEICSLNKHLFLLELRLGAGIQ